MPDLPWIDSPGDQALPAELDYPIVQTWAFGNALLMINLAGEVVVDYSVRLKKKPWGWTYLVKYLR